MQNEDFEEDVYVDVNSLPLRPPQPMIPPEKAVRRPWHPVMWDDSLVGIPQPDHSESDDEIDCRPRWESPYINFAEAEKARIKNSHNPTDLEREMVSPILLKAMSVNSPHFNLITAVQPRPQSRGEYPHKQRIRNLRKLIADGKVKPTPETLIFFLCNKFAVSDERQKKVVL